MNYILLSRKKFFGVDICGPLNIMLNIFTFGSEEKK